jgi:hypothetical protein
MKAQFGWGNNVPGCEHQHGHFGGLQKETETVLLKDCTVGTAGISSRIR